MENNLERGDTTSDGAIDAGVVDYVAKLARLSVSADERNRLADDLAKILGHMAMLETLDTQGVQPTSHPLDLTNATDQDVPRPSLLRSDVLKNAPATADDAFFAVPPVIKGDGA